MATKAEMEQSLMTMREFIENVNTDRVDFKTVMDLLVKNINAILKDR